MFPQVAKVHQHWSPPALQSPELAGAWWASYPCSFQQPTEQTPSSKSERNRHPHGDQHPWDLDIILPLFFFFIETLRSWKARQKGQRGTNHCLAVLLHFLQMKATSHFYLPRDEGSKQSLHPGLRAHLTPVLATRMQGSWPGYCQLELVSVSVGFLCLSAKSMTIRLCSTTIRQRMGTGWIPVFFSSIKGSPNALVLFCSERSFNHCLWRDFMCWINLCSERHDAPGMTLQSGVTGDKTSLFTLWASLSGTHWLPHTPSWAHQNLSVISP